MVFGRRGSSAGHNERADFPESMNNKFFLRFCLQGSSSISSNHIERRTHRGEREGDNIRQSLPVRRSRRGELSVQCLGGKT